LLTAEALVNRRTTPAGDEAERTCRRTKQNLDVAATLNDVAGLGEFVMLLEDDTHFQQPNSTDFLEVWVKSIQNNDMIPTWSRSEFGFGYSGSHLHYTDLHML